MGVRRLREDHLRRVMGIMGKDHALSHAIITMLMKGEYDWLVSILSKLDGVTIANLLLHQAQQSYSMAAHISGDHASEVMQELARSVPLSHAILRILNNQPQEQSWLRETLSENLIPETAAKLLIEQAKQAFALLYQNLVG